MTVQFGKGPFFSEDVLKIVAHERVNALSLRELNFRLRAFGYAVEERDEGVVITSVPRGDKICDLPAELQF